MVFRGALTVDRTAFVPLRGLRCALAVTVMLGLGVAAGQPQLAVLATFGALTAGTVSLTQGIRTPYLTMATAGVVTALSTAVGSLTAHALPLALLALAVWGLLAGLLVGAGGAATTVGVQGVIGLVVLGRFPLAPAAAAQAAAAVLVGAAAQIACCAVLRPPARDDTERRSLAALATVLAAWAAAPGQFRSSQADAALETTRALLDRRARWSVSSPLRSVLTSLSRTRLELGALVAERGHRAALAPEIDAFLDRVGQDLTRLAGALRQPRQLGAGRRGDDRVRPAVAALSHEQLRRDGNALAGQLRAATNALMAWSEADPGAPARLRGARPPAATVLPRAVLSALRHPAPAALRHAVRLALLLPFAEGLAQVLPLQRGYWVALTVIVVLKPDYATSLQRGAARVLGTMVGVVPGSVFVAAVHPHGALLVLVVGVLAWVSYATFPAGYALYSAALSALVVVLLNVISPAGFGAAGTRAVDTALGGALALVAYLALPSWEGRRLPEALAQVITAQARYGQHLFGAYAGRAPDRAALPAAVRTARSRRSDLLATLGRVEAEPARAGSAGAGQGRDALAALSRILTGLQVLHAHVDEVAGDSDRAALDRWAQAFTAALDGAAALARAGGAAPGPVDARAAGRGIGAALPTASGLRSAAAGLLVLPTGAGLVPRVLAREVDELVDAVNSLVFVLGPARPGEQSGVIPRPGTVLGGAGAGGQPPCP